MCCGMGWTAAFVRSGGPFLDIYSLGEIVPWIDLFSSNFYSSIKLVRFDFENFQKGSVHGANSPWV